MVNLIRCRMWGKGGLFKAILVKTVKEKTDIWEEIGEEGLQDNKNEL